MKKIISFLIAISFIVPSLAFAQTTSNLQTTYTSTLRQLISLLTQEVAQLEQQLAALNAKQNTSPSAIASSTVASPTSTQAQPSESIAYGAPQSTSTPTTSNGTNNPAVVTPTSPQSTSNPTSTIAEILQQDGYPYAGYTESKILSSSSFEYINPSTSQVIVVQIPASVLNEFQQSSDGTWEECEGDAEM